MLMIQLRLRFDLMACLVSTNRGLHELYTVFVVAVAFETLINIYETLPEVKVRKMSNLRL